MILGCTFTTFLDVFIEDSGIIDMQAQMLFQIWRKWNEYIGWILRYDLIVVCMNVTNKFLSNAMNVGGIID